MAYSSKNGHPQEMASKNAHSRIINDETVSNFLKSVTLPALADAVMFDDAEIATPDEPTTNPIEHIIAIDGGYQDISVRDEFPSARIAFFQIGALMFRLSDLESLDDKPFIEPSDIGKLQQMERFKFAFPTKGVVINGQDNYKESARKSIMDFFSQPIDSKPLALAHTLKWFLFEEYSGSPLSEWRLASCPYDDCDMQNLDLKASEISADCEWKCPRCTKPIYITDVFRLHEVIDNEQGGMGVLGYMVTTIEHMFLIYIIKLMLQTKPYLLKKVLFVKDGPLAFFGQTANMHKPMRKLTDFLFDNHNLYLVGLEKSGTFTEHAYQIEDKLEAGQLLIPSNKYIYDYIMPGVADNRRPYGSTTYYGLKTIYKAKDSRLYVPIIPSRTTQLNPTLSDMPNADVILMNLAKLKCDLYENALIPIALANKLVSLSDHPSAQLLQKFARGAVQ